MGLYFHYSGFEGLNKNVIEKFDANLIDEINLDGTS